MNGVAKATALARFGFYCRAYIARQLLGQVPILSACTFTCIHACILVWLHAIRMCQAVSVEVGYSI